MTLESASKDPGAARREQPPRSLLFVPATEERRYIKAPGYAADMVCVDLEDGLPPGQKDSARPAAMAFVTRSHDGNVRRAVRINAVGSCVGMRDLRALAQAARLPDAVLLPKVGCADEVATAHRVLAEAHGDGVSLMALVESAAGLERAAEIAAAPGVRALMFGSADWCAEVGAEMCWDALLVPRVMLVNAAASTGIAALDGAWLQLGDGDGLLDECRRVAALGMAGKPAIHPAQIEVIHRGLRPDDAQIAGARRLLRAWEGGGVAVVDGRMVDRPLVLAARRILARAGISAAQVD